MISAKDVRDLRGYLSPQLLGFIAGLTGRGINGYCNGKTIDPDLMRIFEALQQRYEELFSQELSTRDIRAQIARDYGISLERVYAINLRRPRQPLRT